MTDNSLPKWSARLDAFRQFGFSDLNPMLNHHFRAHEAAENFLGPYNAKQRSSRLPYQAPDKETLKQFIKQGSMNDFSYQAFINSLIKFCEQTKGTRGLPTPHPSIIHNIQLPVPAFEISSAGSGVSDVNIIGIQEPIKVKGLRMPDDIKFIILRPKLSSLGTASAKNWEVLFFKFQHGYIPEWVDSNLNPRFSGRF